VTILVRIPADRPLLAAPLAVQSAPAEPDELLDVDHDLMHAYRLGLALGWGDSFAVSWAAWAIGLPPTSETGFRAWSLRELRHLRFLRETRERWS
jgi:hypothetical protein